MGTVPIWKQWLIIAPCVLVSPIIVIAVAGAFCWLLIRRIWPGREVGPGPGRRQLNAKPALDLPTSTSSAAGAPAYRQPFGLGRGSTSSN